MKLLDLLLNLPEELLGSSVEELNLDLKELYNLAKEKEQEV